MKILVGGSSMPPELQGLGSSQIFLDLGWVDNGRVPYVVVFRFWVSTVWSWILAHKLLSFVVALVWFEHLVVSQFGRTGGFKLFDFTLECWSARFILTSCTIRARRIDWFPLWPPVFRWLQLLRFVLASCALYARRIDWFLLWSPGFGRLQLFRFVLASCALCARRIDFTLVWAWAHGCYPFFFLFSTKTPWW